MIIKLTERTLETCLALIHDNKMMPLVKKIHYLKEYLKGESARIISRIPLSKFKGCESAWELIFNRYDNPQRQFETYL